MDNIIIGGIYRHYKGNVYKIICIAKSSETLEELVVYKDMHDQTKVWARPIGMWNDIITQGDQEVRRFTYIGQI
jgi:hypothetical protein